MQYGKEIESTTPIAFSIYTSFIKSMTTETDISYTDYSSPYILEKAEYHNLPVDAAKRCY